MENAHPLVVHFPIALLVTALALETVGLILRREACRRAAWWNLVLGALGAAAAALTGRAAAAAAKHSFEIHEVMTQHERLGYLVLGLAGAAVSWRFATRASSRRRDPWIGWALMVVLVGALAAGAHLGGRLVYEYGVGGVYGRSTGIEIVTHEH